MEITSTKYHDEKSKTYDKSYNEPFWRFYNDITWSYIEKCLPKDIDNSLVLDAGGGTGLWSIKIAKMGYNVILSDISSGMLKIAEEKIKDQNLSGKIKIVKCDITNMNEFKDNTFDLTIAEGDPVSYCSNPDQAISEIARVTKKGCYITVSVDNKFTWFKRSIEKGDYKEAERIMKTGIAKMPTEDGNYYPAFTFTIEELSEIFEKNNIDIIEKIGKPVFTSSQDTNDEEKYRKHLEIELKYSNQDSFAGFGGHIAIVGKKK